MALFRVGGVASEVRGSIGGQTYSRNAGGAYIRNRVVPVNPGSVFQSAVRSALANLTQRWVDTLTEAQREGWEAYAEAVPLPNPLGDPRNIGGLPMYVRSNTPRVQAIAPPADIVDDAPTLFIGASYTVPSLAGALESTQQVAINFTNTDAWANEDDGAMLFWVSRPTNVTRNFFKGPYRFADVVLGDAITPPTSPVLVDLPFAAVQGQRIHVRANVTRADARLGTAFRDNTDVNP